MSSPDPLLVTTSHSLLRMDPDSGAVEPLHRGLGLYFGIASDGDHYYVAARGRMVSSGVPADEERGRILVFDRDLRLAGEVVAPFALRDMHEILWHAGKLWITCSHDNMVAILTAASGRWERWFPLGETPAPPYDVNHLNSLAIVEGRLCMIAHNFGASELLRFDVESRELLSRTPFGRQSHNIREFAHGALITCSSEDGALVGSDGWRLEVGGFPRGIFLGTGGNYVGISEIAERKERDLSTGSILAFDSHWHPLRTLSLPGEGLVLDIQRLP
jgi:hypothetical protein